MIFSRRISVGSVTAFGSIFIRRSRYHANNNPSSSTYLIFIPAPPIRRLFLLEIKETVQQIL